jgi:hypothetical protein
MKISNFKLENEERDGEHVIFTGTVEVVTGSWFWKKKTVKGVKKKTFLWFWTDNGELTPGELVENAARVFAEKSGKHPKLL